jgi:hypothetical protein
MLGWLLNLGFAGGTAEVAIEATREGRILTVPARTRSLTVEQRTRTITVPQRVRSITVDKVD